MENPEVLNHRLSEYFRSTEATGPLKEISGGSLAKEFGSLINCNESGSNSNLPEKVLRKDGNSYRATKLTSFSDLYERAVKNVLNIRPFLEDVEDKLKGRESHSTETRNEVSTNDQNQERNLMPSENPLTVNGCIGDNKERLHQRKCQIKTEKLSENEESPYYLSRRRDGNHPNGFFSQVLAEHARFFGTTTAYVPHYFPHAVYTAYEPHFDPSLRPPNLFHSPYGAHNRWFPPSSSHQRECIDGLHPWGRSPGMVEHNHSILHPDSMQHSRRSTPANLKTMRGFTTTNLKTEPPAEPSEVNRELSSENDSKLDNILRNQDDAETDQSLQSQSPNNDASGSEKDNEAKRPENEVTKSRLKDSQQRMKYRPYGLRSRTSFLNQTVDMKGRSVLSKKKDSKMLELKKKNMSPKEKYLLYLGLFKVRPNGTKQNNLKSCGTKQNNGKSNSKFCKEK